MKIITMLACMLIFFATPVAADAPPENDYAMRIAVLEAQLAQLMEQLSAAAFQPYMATGSQRRETAYSEQLMFRMMYYGVVFAELGNEFMARQLALTERMLKLEAVRLELGLTTQIAFDEMAAAEAALRREIETSAEATRTQRRQVERQRGSENFDFIQNFALPRPASRRTEPSGAEELRTNLVNRNASLALLESHISALSWSPHAAWQERELLLQQRALFIRQLELAADATWSAYLAARSAHILAEAERPRLAARLELADSMYALGHLSETDHVAMRFGVYAEIFAVDAAAVALAIAITEVNFMNKGILGG